MCKTEKQSEGKAKVEMFAILQEFCKNLLCFKQEITGVWTKNIVEISQNASFKKLPD